MRVVAVTLQAAVVVALAAPGAAALHAWPVARAAEPAAVARATVPATLVPTVAAPEAVSFDDLRPTEATATVTATASAAPKAVRTARRSAHHAPADSPAKGTAQYVLARAYRAAASEAPASCHLTPYHLAGIGQVESGSVGGRQVSAEGSVTPQIYGPVLDGGPFAVVHDSDRGALDGVADYDRAMGPLQFLPGTWRWAGADGNDDGRRDPQNVFDAALATAGYLCDGGRDLSVPSSLRSAVLSYNASDAYVDAVVGWVDYFRQHGLAALDDVAYRVGSGGRASDLEVPAEPVEPPDDQDADEPDRPRVTTAPASRETTPAATRTTTPAPTPSSTAPPPTPSSTTPTPLATSTTPPPTPTTTTPPAPEGPTTSTP